MLLTIFGATLDVGLLVVGSGLVGLAFAVLLDGFSVVDLQLTHSAGAMLGSGIVIAIFGAFALGVASEGPIGHGHRGMPITDLEQAVGRVVGQLLVGFGFMYLGGLGARFVGDLPAPFTAMVDLVRAAGVAGATAVLVLGVPAVLAFRRLEVAPWWLEEVEAPLLYVVWAVATAILFLMG